MLEICNFRHPWYLPGLLPTQILGQLSRGNAGNISGWNPRGVGGAPIFGNNWCLHLCTLHCVRSHWKMGLSSAIIWFTAHFEVFTFTAHFSQDYSHLSLICQDCCPSPFVFPTVLSTVRIRVDFLSPRLLLLVLFPMHFSVQFLSRSVFCFVYFQPLFMFFYFPSVTQVSQSGGGLRWKI